MSFSCFVSCSIVHIIRASCEVPCLPSFTLYKARLWLALVGRWSKARYWDPWVAGVLSETCIRARRGLSFLVKSVCQSDSWANSLRVSSCGRGATGSVLPCRTHESGTMPSAGPLPSPGLFALGMPVCPSCHDESLWILVRVSVPSPRASPLPLETLPDSTK